jgi:thymidylate synthase
MVNAWNVGELDQMVLPPCHYGFQVYTRELNKGERMDYWFKNNKPNRDVCDSVDESPEEEQHKYFDGANVPKRAISLMWNQRSNDFFLGIPYNIPSYALLLEIIAREVNMIPEEVIGNLGDVHLYLNHIEQAKEQIKREPYALPTLRIVEDYLGLYALDFDRKIEMMKPSFFAVDNYVSHPTIKAPLSN